MRGSGDAIKKLESDLLLVKADVDALIASLKRSAAKTKHSSALKKLEAVQQAQFDKAVADCKVDVADLLDSSKSARRSRASEDAAPRGASAGRMFAL